MFGMTEFMFHGNGEFYTHTKQTDTIKCSTLKERKSLSIENDLKAQVYSTSQLSNTVGGNKRDVEETECEKTGKTNSFFSLTQGWHG